ncbi:MAG: phenylalanine--tRNA ligase beta subunit-related protein [Acidimicrobiales bacterium]
MPTSASCFGMRKLRNATIGQSPLWLASRPTAAGMRPINAMVDISNYVMLELGQPNHTYDLDKIDGATLGVRMGRDGEKLITLDSVERSISSNDGVIVDGNDAPIGLAGVMGGESTEIDESTVNVVLEAAVWDRMTIAKTVRQRQPALRGINSI